MQFFQCFEMFIIYGLMRYEVAESYFEGFNNTLK
jgi:hypothetical protein